MNEGIVSPILLAGGSGTRLWPLSRRDYPKQFVTLVGETSLFQQTCDRIQGEPFRPAFILGQADHRFLIAEQALESGLKQATVVLEPMGRDTAPAACMAALLAAREDPDRLVLLMPCDHLIADNAQFRASISNGIAAAQAGQIVVFGVVPNRPETGYGYIELDPDSPATGGLPRAVKRFVEKPSLEVAQDYLASGSFLWNAGLFLFRAETLLQHFESLQPEILEWCTDALANASVDLDFVRLEPSAYEKAPRISLDYAIMEKVTNIACVALETGWSDCGSWTSIQEIAVKDADGNATRGDVILEDTKNCLVYAEDACVAMIGLEDVVTIATQDAVLVTSRARAGDLKGLVEKLHAQGRPEAVHHPRVHRPWGWYQGLSLDSRYQVKSIMVKPGAKLSLQSHMHRAEHWIVVSGTVEVVRGDEAFLLTENESTYIPTGARHRLSNPGRIPALLIEVQSGPYLGEDDIIRYDDVYGRSPETTSAA
ncbi:mannose-1-phosphate guanylyltransferase/mannose-6-phosphate isomerase [Rhodoligotrophos appendicifer]|uniref:mannose-1-phosphate guanylyltransferase/mannose-6-phosphate isomerase n=1 Tax=Rhodoligotrophos appendicifer TaxID=987056 RepID=UPI0011865DB7|nr:mannose-1-phosphate guanylyltransferase/mannose-6-phosphate isomerase [Rhodoligotrophos appendicifer]